MNLKEVFIQHKFIQRKRTFSNISHDQSERLISLTEMIFDTYKSGSRILAFGNGGSAAESQHFVAELVGRYHTERAPLDAVALNADTAIITAISNDFGYEEIFSRQVRGYSRKNDLVIGFSTSGKSNNVIKALKEAIARGCNVALFTGENKVDECIEKNAIIVRSPSSSTALIQEIHLSYIHILCEMLDLLIQDENYFRKAINFVPKSDSIYGLTELEQLIAFLRDSLHLSIGFVNGCFDILHQGHLELLSRARESVDILVVAINSDNSVKRIKGDPRPILNQMERARALLATGNVDYVITFDELTPIEVIRVIKPSVVFKGSEYAETDMPERPTVESYGGIFQFIQAVPGISTSRIISICSQS